MLDLFHAFIEYAKKNKNNKSIFGKHNMQIYDLSSM